MSVGPSGPVSFNVNQPLHLNFRTILNEQPLDLSHILKQIKKRNASGMKNQASEKPVMSQEQRRYR